MMVFAIGLLFAGYSVSSYGYVLAKGYDISLREWFSPLNPYRWPAGKVPTVPKGKIWPAGSQAPPGSPGGRGQPGGGGGPRPHN
jgi:hypothetical protein